MSILPHFSHLYIEEDAWQYPMTRETLERFPRATTIPIKNYKEVFNRPRQRWDHQRQSLKAILAVRRDAFLYPGSSFVPNFDHGRFFYTTPIINCIYCCEYCYLQGMFPTANMVVFVNSEDFLSAAHSQLTGEPAYLCISYDTDLLALEDLFHYSEPWVEFAHRNPHITLELRTKSSNFRALSHLKAPPNFILAWTLSPDDIVTRFEHRTPTLEARCRSIREAQAHGWRVRVCFDPLLMVRDWQRSYGTMIEQVTSMVDLNAVSDISIGVFRINSTYLRNMQERNPSSRLLAHAFVVENGSASYSDADRSALQAFIIEHLRRHVPEDKIRPVPHY